MVIPPLSFYGMIPIPKGLELPEVPAGENITLQASFEVENGMLELVAIEGVPVENESEEEPEDEADFVSAVNSQLSKPQ